MQLDLKRYIKTDKSTIGHLFVDGKLFCYTLEDVVRPEGDKVYGKTAIPYGTYIVTLDYSNRFNRVLPRVLDVPGFEGIRIHPGNTDSDTLGCILVGDTKVNDDFIGNSKAAFNRLFPLLQDAFNQKEQILLTITEAEA